jgi:hypothetical protein
MQPGAALPSGLAARTVGLAWWRGYLEPQRLHRTAAVLQGQGNSAGPLLVKYVGTYAVETYSSPCPLIATNEADPTFFERNLMFSQMVRNESYKATVFIAGPLKKDGGEITIGMRGGLTLLGVESPPCPQKLLRLEVIGTVKSNRVTERLG